MLFIPKNKHQEKFEMSLWAWGLLSEEAFGTYFPVLSKNGNAYFLEEVDERFEENNYGIVPMDREGFYVTDVEAKVLARMINYYARLQLSLNENEAVNKKGYHVIRKDWAEHYKGFAEWLKTCEGFVLKEN